MVLKRNRVAAVAAVLLAAGLLHGCGGGGNESGDPELLRVFPEAVSYEGKGSCPDGLGPEVFVFGGQPPYKLSNTVPDAIILSTTQVMDSGKSFTFLLTGACMENMPIVIEDDMGRLTTFSVTVTEGEPE